jgi:IclR family transcriptional regulator, KDG regulon repressor
MNQTTFEARNRAGAKRQYSITAVQRALRLLKVFDADRRELSLAEMSRLTGINKSTVMRTLATLAEDHYVAYDETTQRYRLGIELFRLGNLVSEAMDLRSVAKPYIEAAGEEAGLIVHLGILDRQEIVIIEKHWPSVYRDSVTMVSRVGGIVPLHCTGVGKVLLAFREEGEARRMLQNVELTQYSERTITSIPNLMEDLRVTRKRGYAINDGEHEPYIKCYTMPIFDHNDQVVAAMSLTGLRDVINQQDREAVLATLRRATAGISKGLGYVGRVPSAIR